MLISAWQLQVFSVTDPAVMPSSCQVAVLMLLTSVLTKRSSNERSAGAQTMNAVRQAVRRSTKSLAPYHSAYFAAAGFVEQGPC